MRVSDRYLVKIGGKPTYKAYVEKMKRKGKKPLSKIRWKALVFGAKVKDSAKAFMKKFKPSKEFLSSLKKAPENIQKFFVDPGFRKESSKKMGKFVVKKAVKLAKDTLQAAKDEATKMARAGKALKSVIKEKRKPTKEEMGLFLDAGLYAAGIAIGVATAGAGLGSMVYAGSGALVKGIASNVGVRSVESLLGVGGLKDMADVQEVFGVVEVLGKILKGASTQGDEFYPAYALRYASDSDAEEFLAKMYKQVGKTLSKGFSDEDMKQIVQG